MNSGSRGPEAGVHSMYLLNHDGDLGKEVHKFLKVCTLFCSTQQGLKTNNIWEYKSSVFSEVFEMRK